MHALLTHLIAETHRHAGHADVIRELVDGVIGMQTDATNLADADAAWWASYRERPEAAARRAGEHTGPPPRSAES